MRDRFLAAWRTAAQAAFALLLGWAANRGLHIDPHYSGLVEIAVIGAGAGVWAALTHWLQSRTGNDWRARTLRLLGQILVFGAPGVATYPPAVSGAHTAVTQ